MKVEAHLTMPLTYVEDGSSALRSHSTETVFSVDTAPLLAHPETLTLRQKVSRSVGKLLCGPIVGAVTQGAAFGAAGWATGLAVNQVLGELQIPFLQKDPRYPDLIIPILFGAAGVAYGTVRGGLIAAAHCLDHNTSTARFVRTQIV